MTPKDELVKGFVYVTAKWADSTHSGMLFRSANTTPEREVFMIPATKIDISDPYFVEVVFWPRLLEKEPVRSIKVFIPKAHVLLIVELKAPEMAEQLGYRKPSTSA